MKRIGQNMGVALVTLVALGCFGALIWVLMHESSEPTSVGARESRETKPSTNTVAQRRGDAGDRFEEDDVIVQDLDLGGVESLRDDQDEYAVDENDESDDDDYDDYVDDEDEDYNGDEDDDDGDEDASIARTRELVAQRVAAITASADNEAVDSDWAPAMEFGIEDGLAANGPPGTLVSTTCRTTICITEIELPPGADNSIGMRWLTDLGLAGGLFVQDQAEPGASARTTAYLAREGYPLPGSGEQDQ